jgi:hypothetical protein
MKRLFFIAMTLAAEMASLTVLASNPSSPQGVKAQVSVDNPQGVYQDSYDLYIYYFPDSPWNQDTEMHWNNATGGTATYYVWDDSISEFETVIDTWSPALWPQYTSHQDDCYVEVRTADNYSLTQTNCDGLPIEAVHGDPEFYGDGTSYWKYKEDATLKLATGGPKNSQRKNLWLISANVGAEDPVFPNIATKIIPPNQITVGSLGNLDTNGNLYVVLPDNQTFDVTLHCPAPWYWMSVTAQKYKSYFEVFVCQPWPNYPNDGFNNDPDDPFYNPAPPGYPFFRIGVNAGHAWWNLTTDAPIDVINQFARNTNAANWLGSPRPEVGYGPASSIIWTLPWKIGTAPGELPFPNGDSPTTNVTYIVGFQGPGLIDGLNYTEGVHENPGTYSIHSPFYDCVSHTAAGAGMSVGISLPNDITPEFFGFDLPPAQ